MRSFGSLPRRRRNRAKSKSACRKSALQRTAFARTREQIAYQGNAHVEGYQQKILQQARTPLQLFVNQLRLIFFAPHHRDNKFQKIHAAFFTFAALPLFVLARRTHIAQRGMAALAKTRNLAHLAIAFRTVHSSILRIAQRPGASRPFWCVHTVT